MPSEPTTKLEAEMAAAAKTDEKNAALAALCLQVLPLWARQLTAACEHSAEAVQQLLLAFKDIQPILSAVERQNPDLAQKVDQVLMGLQFQDRLSQMLGLITKDMVRLHAILDDPAQDAKALVVHTWMDQLRSQYAMAEQHHHHDAAPGNASAADDGDTTFF